MSETVTFATPYLPDRCKHEDIDIEIEQFFIITKCAWCDTILKTEPNVRSMPC